MSVRGRLIAVGLLVACTMSACTTVPESSTEPTDQLEVVSWWTSGSEQRALRVLFDAYQAGHSEVTVTSGAVAGGAGSNAQVVLAQRLLAGDPPTSGRPSPAAPCGPTSTGAN